jgi:LmbE family N-acetylglucosaminyl deacetylase
MTIIYLSPHLDDAALSCGGLIWEQTHSGDAIQVWTICAGDPPRKRLSPFAEGLHQRWQIGKEAPALRREEDKQSCHILGAKYRHLDIPDAIYRLHPKTKEYLYNSEEAIMGNLAKSERPLLRRVTTQIAEHLPQDSLLISPLSLGNHVDHQLTRQAAEVQKATLAFYADFPYVIDHKSTLYSLLPHSCQPITYTISQEGLTAWQDSIATYASQISTFWENTGQMKEAICNYQEMVGGITLWFLPNFPEGNM